MFFDILGLIISTVTAYLEYPIKTKKNKNYTLKRIIKWTFQPSLLSIGQAVLKKIRFFTDYANDEHKVMTINTACDPLVQAR